MIILGIGLAVCGVLAGLVLLRRFLRRASGGVFGTIEGFVGRPGQGKTTMAVQWAFARADLIASFGRRVTIASNIELHHEVHPTVLLPVGEHGFDMEVLVRLCMDHQRDGGAVVLLVDEANIVMPARMWKDYGLWLMWFFQQSRHLHVEVVWTAQSETFVDSQLRQLTAATHSVRATPPATVVTMLSGSRPLWIGIDTWDRTAVGTVEAWLGGRRVRYRREWESAYNTREFVLPPTKLPGAAALVDLLQELLSDHGGGLPPAQGEAEPPSAVVDPVSSPTTFPTDQAA
jgi:Zonular occludens toxin (Zot)